MERDALKELLIAPDVSVRDAIAAIDRSGRQIALVVDAENRLVATVTDGDVRRGILRGVDLDGPVSQVMHESPTTVTEGAPDGETRALIRSRKLQHVPVLDGEGHLVDLALVEDLFGVTPKGHTCRPDGRWSWHPPEATDGNRAQADADRGRQTAS